MAINYRRIVLAICLTAGLLALGILTLWFQSAYPELSDIVLGATLLASLGALCYLLAVSFEGFHR